MAKKTKQPQGKRADDYLIGDVLWEGDYSAGVIVSKVQCPERAYRVWMLLRDSNRRYTIYSVQKSAVCSPVVSRMIPETVVERMFMEAFKGVELPDDIPDHIAERFPVPKKSLR